MKPLGLDKNKVRAALNNVKSGNLTPKRGNSPNANSASSAHSSNGQVRQAAPESLPLQVPNGMAAESSSLNKSNDSSFGNYTFSMAQNGSQN